MVHLIHPPVSKPGEAPAGPARLAGALKHYGVPFRFIDANLEGLLYLLGDTGAVSVPDGCDTWTRRAFRHRATHLQSLRSWLVYNHPDRYRRAVADLSRILETSAPAPIRLGLANYEDPALTPAKSVDLLRAATSPDINPFYPYFKSRLTAILEEEAPCVVGFSLNYLSQALCTFAMAGFLRQAAPAVKIILGGGLVTSWCRRLEGRNPFTGLIDALIAGPGEEPLLAMAGKSWDGTPFYPDYSAFPLTAYLSPGTVLPFSASRGCYWRQCSFCPETAEGNPYHPIPPARVMEEIGQLTLQTQPALIHFLDNAMSPVLLKTLAQGAAETPWYGFARVAGHLTDEGFCRDMKKAGCVMLKLGLESGSQTVLDDLRKGIDLDTASRSLKSLKAAGIATYVYLLFGTPAETPADARKTLDFVVQHGEMIDFLNVAIFNLPLEASEGLDIRPFSDGDLSLYRDFVHPRGWDRSHVRHFLDREFKRHPVVSRILRNDPPVFTSNHAPFLQLPGRT